MAQHDYIIDNANGAAVRADINNMASAIVTNNSGATEPATRYAYMFWVDTTAGLLKQRNASNTAWNNICKIGTRLAQAGTESTLASAATTNLGSAANNLILITGTTAITAFGSSAETDNPLYILRFAAALTLTHNATSLILPGNANITTAAGDSCVALYLGSGNWRVLSYARASGTGDVTLTGTQTLSNKTLLNPAIRDATDSTKGEASDFTGASASAIITSVKWPTANRFHRYPDKTGTFIMADDALVAQGRLTLTSGTPVTTSDVTAASTLFYTPYIGNKIALFDGSEWRQFAFTERSLTLSSLVSGRPYDVFLFDNSGTLTLELTAWTNDTTRATALTTQDGVLVRSGATTRRYLGTIYTTGTTTTEDSLAARYLYNEYNQVVKSLYAGISVTSYTYSTATWRTANLNTTNGDGRFSWVQGQLKNRVVINAARSMFNSLNAAHVHGVAINGTTSAQLSGTRGYNELAAIATVPCATATAGALGLNYAQAMELGAGSGTTTFYGQSIGGGMVASLMC